MTLHFARQALELTFFHFSLSFVSFLFFRPASNCFNMWTDLIIERSILCSYPASQLLVSSGHADRLHLIEELRTYCKCHGMTSLPLLHPPLAASNPICLHSTSSASTLLQLQCVLVQLV